MSYSIGSSAVTILSSPLSFSLNAEAKVVDFPDPVGVLYAVEDVTYEDMMMDQLNEAVKKKDKNSIQDIINSGDTWVVK